MSKLDFYIRLNDLFISIILLIFFAPLFLLIATLILVFDGAPIFFRQVRTGKDCVFFTIIKFRSLKNEQPHNEFIQVIASDSRVNGLGRFLRKTSLDELPQLINVIRGDMSLVGPRPHVLDLDERFEKIIDDYSMRNTVKPGMTGLAQVRGHRGPTESVLVMARRVKLDNLWIQSRSIRLYYVILFKTVRVVLGDVKAF